MLRLVQIGGVVAVLALLGVLLAVALSRSSPRYAGYNAVRESGPAVTLDRRGEACQPFQVLPRDAAAVELNVSSPGPLPALDVVVHDGQATLARGSLGAGSPPGRVRVPLGQTVRETVGASTLCVSNKGLESVVLVGAKDAKAGLRLNGREVPGLFRIAYVRPGSESWFSTLGVLAHRFSLAKANWVGAWTFWLLVALMLGVLVITVRIALQTRPAGTGE